MTDKIYLNIAGFNLLFRIHFTDQRYHTEKFINMLNTDYAGFISNKKEKADFVFDIHSDGSVMLNIEELDKKTKSFNIRLFHINEKKTYFNDA